MPRSGELQCALWSEFDLKKRVWTIPAERMKRRIEDRIPLTDASVEILNALRELTGWCDLLLPSLRSPNRPISENTLNQALRNLGYSKDDVRAAYPRGAFWEERVKVAE